MLLEEARRPLELGARRSRAQRPTLTVRTDRPRLPCRGMALATPGSVIHLEGSAHGGRRTARLGYRRAERSAGEGRLREVACRLGESGATATTATDSGQDAQRSPR